MKKIQISPSILSADFSQLGNEIKRLEDAGADMIHVDVMDGHFVPNLTIGPPVIKALKKQSSMIFDVHLMISPVHKYIDAYSDAGADIITIHPEATDDLSSSISKIKQLNKNKALTFFRRNEKETKEHNMIVDMERNDLSKICKTGSVKIDKLKKVEEYRDLFHYVTTIKGVIKNKMSNHDIISSLMPGGSVIGCPKISTIQLLNRKEKFDRNIYTGSFGIIHSNGDMRFNIMIRTLLNFKNDIELSVASGVILGSTAKKEYNENYIKAKSLLDLFN